MYPPGEHENYDPACGVDIPSKPSYRNNGEPLKPPQPPPPTRRAFREQDGKNQISDDLRKLKILFIEGAAPMAKPSSLDPNIFLTLNGIPRSQKKKVENGLGTDPSVRCENCCLESGQFLSRKGIEAQ